MYFDKMFWPHSYRPYCTAISLNICHFSNLFLRDNNIDVTPRSVLMGAEELMRETSKQDNPKIWEVSYWTILFGWHKRRAINKQYLAKHCLFILGQKQIFRWDHWFGDLHLLLIFNQKSQNALLYFSLDFYLF